MTGSILLIEDDADICADLGEMLRDEGFSVDAVRHGAEAIKRLRTRPLPRVILLDLMMPVMNGWDFRAEQLKEPELAKIPVIVMSGRGDAKRQSVELGAREVIEKPIDLLALFDTVAKYCPREPRQSVA